MNSPEKVRGVPGEDAGSGDELFFEEQEFGPKPLKPGANLLFLSQSPGFRQFVSRVEGVFQYVPVLRDLLLVVRPVSAWNSIAATRRGAGFVFFCHLLPTIVLVALVEGYGLTLLGRQQVAEGMNNRFTFPKVFAYETASWLLNIFLLFLAAAIIKSLANTFHIRNYFTQSLRVVFHSIRPMLVVQLMNGFPNMFLWLTWLIGILLTIGALYNALPRIMQPDPPAAMGLFFGSSIIVFLLMLGGRLLTGFYLAGDFKSVEKVLSDIATRIV